MSKFKSLATYEESLGAGYKLLPFRFTPLDSENYVLSNQAGEYLVLDRPALTEFVEHRLVPTHARYGDLKGKHFFLDDDSTVPIDLLALKVRTKHHRLPHFTALHMFVVSLRCEHSCPYCQVSRQSDDRRTFDMSEDTADKALDLVFRSPSPNIKIEFQGGEPLLNFELIRYIVHKAEVKNQTAARNLQFVIATNLALVTDEVLDFCRDHRIQISTSLDGPKDLHSKNRPRPGGDSYERAVAGIHKARAALGRDQVNALMTTTQASLGRVREIIDEYIAQGFSGVFLRTLSPYGFAIKTKSYASYGPERWLEFYKDGLAYILELNKQGHFFIEHYTATILEKMLTPFDTGYVDLMSPAGMGIAAVIYNYNGEVYASDESRMLAEMGDKTFVIGNVQTNTYEEIFLSDKLLDPLEASFAGSVPMCSDCAFEPYCGADPVFHHATQGDFVGRKPTSAFCSRNMAIFRHLISLMNNDAETREIFQRWIGR